MRDAHVRVSLLGVSLLVCLSVWACSADPGEPDASTPEAGSSPVGDAGVYDAGEDGGGVVEQDGGEDAGADAGGILDPCATMNGGCDPRTTCEPGVDGGASCGPCPEGFTGDGTTGCMDIDECTSADAGCGTAECVNVTGSFKCVERPVSVLLHEEQPSPYIGNTGATTRWTQCPAGQVVVGYRYSTVATVPAKITSAYAYCSELTLTGTSVSNLAVSTSPPTSTDANDRVCPANEVVVGLIAGINSSNALVSVTVRCSPLTVAFDADAGLGFSLGAAQNLATYPGGVSAPIKLTGCASDTVAYGTNAAGGQVVAGFALRCARPTFHGDLPELAFDTPTNSPFIGATQGAVEYTDLCPDGGVVSALMVESQWRSFAVRCGTPVLDFAPSVPLMNPETLSRHGSVWPNSELGCGPSAALVGFSLAAGSTYLYQLTLHCAPLGATSSSSGWTVTVDAPTAGPRFGQAVTSNQTTTCPPGTAPIGVNTRTTTQSNSYVQLTDVGLVCATPHVP